MGSHIVVDRLYVPTHQPAAAWILWPSWWQQPTPALCSTCFRNDPMKLPLLTKRAIWTGVGAVIMTVGYFGHTAWQTTRGEAALKATALQFLPLEQALVLAQAVDKPVLVDFSAIWCPTCRALHADVFTDAAVKQAITTGFVLARVDYDEPEARAFMQRYAVQGFPTLLALSSDGRLLRRVPISFNPAALAATLRECPGSIKGARTLSLPGSPPKGQPAPDRPC